MPRPLPPRRCRAVVAALCVLLGSTAPRRPGAAEPASPQPAAGVVAGIAALPDASRPPIVTEHSIRIAAQALAYRAEAGMLPLLKEDGSPRAHVFFVAYTLVGAGDAAERPLMFCFNGGPGAAAVWLHLGGLGPRRALVNADGTLPPPPFTLVDNEHTILPTADLVFVDPVATGYSRAAKDEKPEQFFGTERDVAALAEFVRLYTTRQRRWRSPKYLCGESYGVFRVAGLAAALHDQGMFVNGLVLVSGLVDFGTISPGPSNDLPYTLFLPSMTAVAHHHGRLAPELQADRARALAEARDFAAGEYVTALFAGSALPAARRTALAERIARLTGLTKEVVLDRDLRVDTATFREKLLADRGLVCGRFDGRITGRDGSAGRERPGFDPSFDAALGPLAAAMNAYVREELRFESDSPYHVLTGVSPWSHDENAYSSTAPQLAEVLARNPHLRVLVQAGLCDLAVPVGSVPFSIDHLELDAALRGNVRYAEYDAGHMMYLNGPDLVKFHADLRDFLAPPRAAP